MLEGRLNGDKDTLDEMDDSRKEDRNGFKAKFMFNIADGGFTGRNSSKKFLCRTCFIPPLHKHTLNVCVSERNGTQRVKLHITVS